MNDAMRTDWSKLALGELYESIKSRCEDNHDCLTPYAPHDSVVPDGTFYAFDERCCLGSPGRRVLRRRGPHARVLPLKSWWPRAPALVV